MPENVFDSTTPLGGGASAAKALAGGGSGLNLNLLKDVSVPVRIRFSRTALTLRAALELQPGGIVDLKQPLGEPVELLVHDRPIAVGEIVTVDGNYAVRIQHLVNHEGRVPRTAEVEPAPAAAVVAAQDAVIR